MNAYYENEKVRELGDINKNLTKLLKELELNTKLKKQMLEMMQENEKIKEKMKGINDDNN